LISLFFIGISNYDLLLRMFTELNLTMTEEQNSSSISQIKEKFGELRVYFDAEHSSKVENILRKYQEESSITCEKCGSKDKAFFTQCEGRIQVLCFVCKDLVGAVQIKSPYLKSFST